QSTSSSTSTSTSSSTSTSTTTTSTTTTTMPPTCESIVPGQPIAGAYRQTVVAGPKICDTGSTNEFQLCTTDTDCGSCPGGNPGCCAQTPWVTVGPGLQPLPTGITTHFNVAASGSIPTC